MSRMMMAATEGLVAGAMMAMMAMGSSQVSGQSPWRPVKLIAGAVEGAPAETGGWGTVLLGGMLHMTTSLLWGVLFRPLLRSLGWRGSPPLPVAGTLYGLGIWAINEVAILPAVDPLMARQMPKGSFALSHAVYGVVLGALAARMGPRVETRLASGGAESRRQA